MNILIILAVVGGLYAFRFLAPNALAWATACWVASFLGLRFGIDPPLPSSIVSMLMFIVTLSVFAYLSVDDDRIREVADWLFPFIVDRRFKLPRIITLVTLPIVVAGLVYANITQQPEPPSSIRTIHPPPPANISFRGTPIDLIKADNPYRMLESDDPSAFSAHVDNGSRIYYENCVICHGANMEGDGLFAHGLDPIPANFQDATTIAMLQESYLFWRIAKGAPDLPVESAPWSSSMPASETFLTEEEIWDVILFLYDYTGHRPRAKEAAE